MRLLGIDYETTGLSPENDLITEVGAVVWDVPSGTPLEVISLFLDWKLEKLDPVVTKLTGITLEMLSEFGQNPTTVYKILTRMARVTGTVAHVAHNGETFDRPFQNKWAERVGGPVIALPWVDTQNDIEYPEEIKTRKLTHLAAEHGFLNPFAHRAVFDVLTMFNILQNYDIEKVIALSREPVVYAKALVDYNNRQLASGLSFRWHGGIKTWWRSCKESQFAKLEADAKAAGFKITRINKPPDEVR